MTIALTCQSCDKPLKVRDELSGKKIKCPGCGEIIAVPREKQPAAASAVQKEEPRPKPNFDDDEEDRPRKKKKKKKKSKVGLFIGLGIAVLLLLGLLVLLIVLMLPGKKQEPQAKATEAPKEKPKVNEPPPQPPPKQAAGGIRRAPERADILNMLKQLGLAYNNADITNNKAPTKREDLAPFYENNTQINELLTTNYITFIYGVRPQQMPSGTSNTILAYETLADNSGVRCVLMADGVARTMTTEEFNNTPKAGQK